MRKYIVHPSIKETKTDNNNIEPISNNNEFKTNNPNIIAEMSEHVLSNLEYNCSYEYIKLSTYTFPNIYNEKVKGLNFPFSAIIKPYGNLVV